jgi:uncharacterized protein YqhQ
MILQVIRRRKPYAIFTFLARVLSLFLAQFCAPFLADFGAKVQVNFEFHGAEHRVSDIHF